jgi:hypothetical protein
MRTMTILAFMSLCLSLGCATDESRSRPDETVSEGVGQVEQQVVGATCFSNCDCGLNERCNNQNKCENYFVIGPMSNTCVADCQCYNDPRYGFAYHCDFQQGSYGICVM